jgi:hypothetical protein
MVSPYLLRPIRTVAEAIADIERRKQVADRGRSASSPTTDDGAKRKEEKQSRESDTY